MVSDGNVNDEDNSGGILDSIDDRFRDAIILGMLRSRSAMNTHTSAIIADDHHCVDDNEKNDRDGSGTSWENVMTRPFDP